VSEATAAPVGLDRTGPTTERQTTEAEATSAFSTSVMLSGIRCLLAYVVLPWVLPALGLAGDWGPWLGLVIGPVAIVFNVLSIRRFQASGHRWRWPITAINVTIIALLTVLLVMDLNSILS
jgi:hypothetical protein